MTSPSCDAALDYALHNDWHIVPIPPGQKYPRMKAWQNAASRDTETINQWFAEHPNDGVGIATGAQSGIFVIDVDVADGKTGLTTLTELEAIHGELPETYTVRTGTGGFHYYYLYDPARPIRNGRLGEHIDIRGDGGQVLAPPTIHPTTGIAYQVHLDVPCAHAPDWVYDILLPAKTPDPLAEPNGQNGNPTIPNRESGTNHIGDDELRPGDHFTASTTWEQLLTADGWKIDSTYGSETRWTRPPVASDKTEKTGTSATTNHTGTDRLKCFTSSVPGLDDNGTYDRFGYWAATRHNGDHRAAAVDLAQQGYGTGAQPIDLSYIEDPQPRPIIPANVNPDTGEIIDDGNWDDPIPLGMAPKNLPPFPVEVFPSWLTNQCEAVADDIQVPIDLPATIALAALAAATSRYVEVDADGWTTHTNLYLVVASPPGQGKSPVFAAMTSCLEEIQADLATALAPQISKAEMEHRVAEKQARKAEEKGDIDTAWQHTQTAMAINIPKVPRLIADDATPEALTSLLADNNGRVAIMSSEGGVFDLMTGKYSDRANLEVYLKAWSGDTITVDRIHRDAEYVKKPALTIGLTVQPMVIQRLANKPELAGRGLTARFMYALPPSNVGHRDMTQRRAKRDGQQRIYNANLTTLYTQMASYQTPGKLSLTDQDVDQFFAWRQTIEHRRKQGGDLHPMAEWSTKLEASVLRLCGLLHLADGGPHHGPINQGVLARALTVADYWIEHAFAVHDLWGTDDTLASARIILAWLHRDNIDTFTASDVQKKLRSQFQRIADVADPLALLVERGWVRPLFDGPLKLKTPGKASPAFAVHPTAQPVDNHTGTGLVVREWCTGSQETPQPVSHSRHLSKGDLGALTLSISGPPDGVPHANDANDTQPDQTTPKTDLGGYELL